ncbi:hypothetical protein BCR44DRAFT_51943 [Catenaria anguillulae PL171]|uniref:DUF4470 domain-containing protein n=1 Tax=Catenaria anguillulae PL171 TaxID=765915 RepID=A0A1Y2H6F5_9FUNG|nr:hypothetical protein BCR44DRAFT_51943 [Catenaria anguillulae PL171]
MNGQGPVPMYAASRALDLLDPDNVHGERNVLNIFPSPDEGIKTFDEPVVADSASSNMPHLNVLIFGLADPATILKTMSRLRRHPECRITFDVLESQMPVLAKCILLLFIAIDPSLDELSDDERADLFLELYGSVKIREKTHVWLNSIANELIRIVTDGRGVLGRLIDFSRLRFRDRDDIEFTLKFWKSERPFLIDAMWDNRLKALYGVRYDSRENVVDWDLNMRLKDNCSHLTKPEFLHWRLTGEAFRIRDSTLSHPNRTFATVSSLLDPKEGLRTSKWGYFSDVATGPFVAWGTDTEFRDMLKTANNQPTHCASEISRKNVSAMLVELRQGRCDGGSEPIGPGLADLIERCTVRFLPSEPDKVLGKAGARWDVAVVGSAFAHRAAQVAERVHCEQPSKIAPRMLVETARWNLDVNLAQRGMYCEKIVDMMGKSTAKVYLSKMQGKKVWEVGSKWESVGGLWDYLVFDLSSKVDQSIAEMEMTRDVAVAEAAP